MTGILRNSLPGGPQLSPREALTRTSELGLDGCLFPSLFDISQRLDRAELRDLDQAGRELGVKLGAGAGWLNPYRPARQEAVAAAGGGDFLTGLKRVVSRSAEIAIHDLFFMIGDIEDRFDVSTPWRDQLDATAALLRRFSPVLRDHRSRLLVKTHEEITSFEIVRLIEAVGADVLGVALDPVNVVVRIEDPVEATARLAPYVRQLHIDDAAVRFAPGGLRRLLCPLGEGVIDWRTTFCAMPDVPRWIDLHRGQFTMPVFNREWLRVQPDLSVRELAAVIGMAARAEGAPADWDQSDAAARLQPMLRTLPELAA